jgi:Transcriptional regulator PadR-like family
VHGYVDGLGRFAEPWLLVLTSLADGPKHGYAIMADVADFSGVRLEPGTLYGALARLERRGWVRPLPAGECRRSYEIAATWPWPGRPGRCGRSCAPSPGRASPP